MSNGLRCVTLVDKNCPELRPPWSANSYASFSMNYTESRMRPTLLRSCHSLAQPAKPAQIGRSVYSRTLPAKPAQIGRSVYGRTLPAKYSRTSYSKYGSTSLRRGEIFQVRLQGLWRKDFSLPSK